MSKTYKKRGPKWAPLFTEFQKKAICLIVDGYTNNELEKKLPLGESGVKKLVKRINVLFCCEKRAGIVYFACLRGIVWCGR